MYFTWLAARFGLSEGEYELLPTNSNAQPSAGGAATTRVARLSQYLRFCYRSRLVRGGIVLLVLIPVTPPAYKKGKEWRAERELWASGFPDYADVKEYERLLPQHNLHLEWPEGKNGRFLKFDVPYNHIGFNNQLQDILMSSEMAYLSNRAYAFQPLIYDIHTSKLVVKDWDDGSFRSARIPLNAFLAGPTAGGTMPSSSPAPGWEITAPRAVSYDFFDQVCPKSRRTYVDVEMVRKKWGIEESQTPDGGKMLEAWGAELGSMNQSCVVVTGDHAWTWDAFGQRVLGAWPILQHSPNLIDFQWSPLVRGIVQRNIDLLVDPTSPTTSFDIPNSLNGLVAVHLRRGDFAGHCRWLAYLHAGFNGWNAFPSFVDQFADEEERKNEEVFMRRCLPTVDELVGRLHEIREQYEAVHGKGHELRRVYVLNNAEEPFLVHLKEGLGRDGWEAVYGTQDMEVKVGESEVVMAGDMMIAQRAEVFVGNGWSSLTSDVNLLRMVGGVPTDSIRLL